MAREVCTMAFVDQTPWHPYAREYGVDVLAADELGTLNDYLRKWKGNSPQ